MDLSLNHLLGNNTVPSKVVEDNVTLDIDKTFSNGEGRIVVSIKYGDVEVIIKTIAVHDDDGVNCNTGIRTIIYDEYMDWPEDILMKLQDEIFAKSIYEMSFRDIARDYLINNLNNRLQLLFIDYINKNYSDLDLTNIQYGTINAPATVAAPAGRHLCVYAVNLVKDNRLLPIINVYDERISITEIVITSNDLLFKTSKPADKNKYVINKGNKRVGTFNLYGDTEFKFAEDIGMNELSHNLDQYCLYQIKDISNINYYKIITETSPINFNMESDDSEIVVNYAFIPI
jgi:hypothetical protein